MKINKKQITRIAGISGAILSIYLFSLENNLGGLIVLSGSLAMLLWKFKGGWFI